MAWRTILVYNIHCFDGGLVLEQDLVFLWRKIMNITKIITVRVTHGADTTYLHTDLPNGIWPFTDSEL